MATFLVERYLPSTTAADIAAAIERLSVATLIDRGPRHLWTAIIEPEETCLSLFEATSAAAVEAANRTAHFSFDRVVEISIIEGNS